MGTRHTCVPLPPAQVLQSCSPVSASHFGIDCIAVGSLASHSRRSDGCGLYAWRRANPGQKVWAGEPWILFWRRTWVAEVSGRDTRTRRLYCVQKAPSGDRISDTQHPIGWGEGAAKAGTGGGVEVSRKLARHLHQRRTPAFRRPPRRQRPPPCLLRVP